MIFEIIIEGQNKGMAHSLKDAYERFMGLLSETANFSKSHIIVYGKGAEELHTYKAQEVFRTHERVPSPFEFDLIIKGELRKCENEDGFAMVVCLLDKSCFRVKTETKNVVAAGLIHASLIFLIESFPALTGEELEVLKNGGKGYPIVPVTMKTD